MGLVALLEALWRMGAIGIRGLADVPCLPCKVEVLEVGEAACDASDSTSSIVFPCQPLFTLTIAYDNFVLSSAESCASVSK